MKRAHAPEKMDDASLTTAELRHTLRVLDRIHWLLGTLDPVLGFVGGFLSRVQRPLNVLDVGAGSGYLGHKLTARFGRRIRYVRMDQSFQVLSLGTDRPTGRSLVARAASLPVKTGRVDLIVSVLLLHHLSDRDAASFLRSCQRTATLGVLHQDLRRSVWSYLGTFLFSRLVCRNRIVHHDAPLSVRRSRTPGEWSDLLAEHGLQGYRLRKSFPFRLHLQWSC